jgi:hypothetical protein
MKTCQFSLYQISHQRSWKSQWEYLFPCDYKTVQLLGMVQSNRCKKGLLCPLCNTSIDLTATGICYSITLFNIHHMGIVPSMTDGLQHSHVHYRSLFCWWLVHVNEYTSLLSFHNTAIKSTLDLAHMSPHFCFSVLHQSHMARLCSLVGQYQNRMHFWITIQL